MNDLELLGEYVQKGSEAAFAELVRRHIDWVQGAALRQVGRVGRRQTAEDVTQGVFIALAQQAGKLLARGRPLGPWLFKVVRYASIATLRAEKRQKQHEQGAAAMRAEMEESLTEAQWDQMAPVLDELVGKLGKKDQEAVLLRFYQRKSLAEVGEEMGVSEAAAQKRCERAVEKLRGMFRRRGMAVGSGVVLAAGLGAYTTTPASAALVAATTQSALAAVQGCAVGGQLLAIAEGAMKMMTIAKVKMAAAVMTAVVVAGVGAGLAAVGGGSASTAAAPAGYTQGGASAIPAVPELNQDSAKGLQIECRLVQKVFTVGQPVNIWCTLTNTTDALKPIPWHPWAGAAFLLTRDQTTWPNGIIPTVIPQIQIPILVRQHPSEQGYVLYLPPRSKLKMLLTYKPERPGKVSALIAYEPVMHGQVSAEEQEKIRRSCAFSNTFEYEVVAASQTP